MSSPAAIPHSRRLDRSPALIRVLAVVIDVALLALAVRAGALSRTGGLR